MTKLLNPHPCHVFIAKIVDGEDFIVIADDLRKQGYVFRNHAWVDPVNGILTYFNWDGVTDRTYRGENSQ